MLTDGTGCSKQCDGNYAAHPIVSITLLMTEINTNWTRGWTGCSFSFFVFCIHSFPFTV